MGWRDRFALFRLRDWWRGCLVCLVQQFKHSVVFAVIIGAIVPSVAVPELKGIWRTSGSGSRSHRNGSKNPNQIGAKLRDVRWCTWKYVTIKLPSPKVNARLVSYRCPEVFRLEDTTRGRKGFRAYNAVQPRRALWRLEFKGSSFAVRDLINGKICKYAHGWSGATVFIIPRKFKSMLRLPESWDLHPAHGSYDTGFDTLEVDKGSLNRSQSIGINLVRSHHFITLLSGVVGISNQNSECNNFEPHSRIGEKLPDLIIVPKVIKEAAFLGAGLVCLIVGWGLIRVVLPAQWPQRTIGPALIIDLLGLLLLFCAQQLICKFLDLGDPVSAPVRLDSQPEERVSLLFARGGQVLPSAPSGVSSCHS